MYCFLNCRATSVTSMAPRDSEIKFSHSLLYLTLLNQVPAFQNNDEDSIIHSSISLNLLWCIGILVLKLCPDSICSFFPIKISCCNRSNSTSTNGISWPWRRHYNNTIINTKWKSEIKIVVCRWFTYHVHSTHCVLINISFKFLSDFPDHKRNPESHKKNQSFFPVLWLAMKKRELL